MNIVQAQTRWDRALADMQVTDQFIASHPCLALQGGQVAAEQAVISSLQSYA